MIAVISTSLTLLHRLQQSDDREAWGRFVDLYSPLLLEWARRNRVPESERADLIQSVLMVLLKRLPQFSVQPGGSFRGWLFTVTHHCWGDRCRANARQPAKANLDPLDPPGYDDPIAELTEREYRNYLLRRILRLVKSDFPEETWKVFCQHVLENRPVAEIASEFGITTNAVYLTRTRILKRLREELAGLMDE